jgi:hypothetical protein
MKDSVVFWNMKAVEELRKLRKNLHDFNILMP